MYFWFLLLALIRPNSHVQAFVSPQTATRNTLSIWKATPEKNDFLSDEDRLKMMAQRRREIRKSLQSAEKFRNLRIKNGWIPQVDEDGNEISEGNKIALTITAFCIAAGAVALRIGGRAALVSVVGLDFLTDNPEMKENLDLVLNTAETMNPFAKTALFTAAWTAVKCLCIDGLGVVLALASGILFGGVLQGALASAMAATIGSSVAFGLAQMDTPVRKKALEVLEEYPSLRGIEKVVARDGLKAILTLRLAPVLPIPLGLYNYIYGVTNVGYFDFAGGIFLGSIKPYLLDSYLGYFGKSLVDGSTESDLQNIILLAALGVSVLIGVFASQLANETWEAVLQEVEEEKKRKNAEADPEDIDDGITREFFGMNLPNWMIKYQIAMQQSDARMRNLVAQEYKAKAWNTTEIESIQAAMTRSSEQPLTDMSYLDYMTDSMALNSVLSESFSRISSPLYDESKDDSLQTEAVATVVKAETERNRAQLIQRLDILLVRAELKLQEIPPLIEDIKNTR